MANELRSPPGSWWNKALGAGVLAGVLMSAYWMIVSAFMGAGFWTPLNMIGATIPAFRPPAQFFEFGPALTGLIIHLIVAAFWGLVLGFFASRLANSFRMGGGALLIGLGWGLAIWIISGLLIGPLVNPVMAMAPPVNYFISHMIYGLSSALFLWAWARDHELSSDYLRRHQTGGGGLRPSAG